MLDIQLPADYRGLLAEMLERPDDNHPRLLLADWYEDQGETQRAEFIRVQIELAKTRTELYLDPDDPADNLIQQHLNELRDRQRELLVEANVSSWVIPLDCGVWWNVRYPNTPTVKFIRRFPEEMSVTQKVWLQKGPLAVSLYPLKFVNLSDCSVDFILQEHVFAYRSCDHTDTHYPGDLNYKIWNLLENYIYDEYSPWKIYPTEKTARNALSHAALLYAHNTLAQEKNRRTSLPHYTPDQKNP